MIKNYFERKFKLRYFEVSESGAASPTTILTLLEETAADHCFAINHSLYQLGEQNIGWVLISGCMQMERYPNYKEEITIRTWLSKYSTIKGFRENIIYDEQNNIIGRAKGLWIFFDTKKRKPTEIFGDIKDKWSINHEKSIDCDVSEKIHAIQNSDHEIKFHVNRYDTDMNKHVNNIRYLQWVVESVPEDIFENYYLNSIEGRFVAEAHYGQTVLSLTKNNSLNSSFTHTIKIEGTDIICATAKTTWKKRNRERIY